MITVVDIIWICIIFILVLVILALLRPVFLLKRNPLTGVPIEIISGWKLLGFSILFTIVIVLIIYLIRMCSYNSHYHYGGLVL